MTIYALRFSFPFEKQNQISLEIGRKKNPNKNPVAERAVSELEIELLKQDTTAGPISNILLVSATSRLNSRIRSRGLSSREMLYQRDQFTNMQIPLTDHELIEKQQIIAEKNHAHSEKSKAPNRPYRSEDNIEIGDLVDKGVIIVKTRKYCMFLRPICFKYNNDELKRCKRYGQATPKRQNRYTEK